MKRRRVCLVPVGKASGSLDGPEKALRDAPPPAQRGFTQADQVNQLVWASEVDADIGFMARLLALCSLPRSNPGNRLQYRRVNGPYTLIMTATGKHKLPFGNLPRLILAWLCTEAVRTRNREIVLGRSLAEFMRELGIYSSGGVVQIRLRSQMRRLFGCTVQLTYKDANMERFVNSPIAESGEYWWNPKRPDQPSLWDSKIELSEKFFNEIISHPVPIDMNTLAALKRSTLGLDLYLWLYLPHLHPPRFATPLLAAGVLAVRSAPGQRQRQIHRPKLPHKVPPRVEEDQDRLAGSELRNGPWRPDPASFDIRYRTFGSSPASKLGRKDHFGSRDDPECLYI